MRVLLVDDHMIIRRGLERILGQDPRITRIAEAADGPGALRELRGERFDVVLLDIALGERDGLDLLKTIRAEFPRIGVIMLSVYAEEQFAVRALRAGAGGYLNKGCTPEALFDALTTVARGGVYASPRIAALLTRTLRSDAERPPHELLSNREFQVLQLLAQGHSVSAIAHQLSLSVNTISTYRHRICEKLGIRSAVDVVTYAARHRLVSLAT
ncbi:MAG: response regulator transcription factor [Burkholderiaceae bacterium]|jgi:DNA-binding NarL/FixJ family response regulator|nr:response regulator transcription factor [Burkholderiaceae bacterium]